MLSQIKHLRKGKTRGSTVMVEVTRIRSAGERKLVEYNDDGVPIGENGTKLQSAIGSFVHHHIPLTYASWKHVPTELKEKIYNIVEAAFIIDGRSKKRILKTASVAFRQFKNWLTTHHILPFKDEPQLLLNPLEMYSFIDKIQWLEFVSSRLTVDFEQLRRLQQERRAKNKYNHRLSRKGYANLVEEMKKTSSSDQCDIGRANLWKKARANKKGEYDNEDVQEVVNRIDVILKDSHQASNKYPSPNDALTQALGTPEHHGRVRGVGAFITPTTYFHTAKRSSKPKTDKVVDENEALRQRVKELEDQIKNSRFKPKSEHGSCSRQPLQCENESEEKQTENKVKKTVDLNTKELDSDEEVSILKVSCINQHFEDIKSGCKEKQTSIKEKTPRKMTKEKQGSSVTTSDLPISLKAILRIAEKVMDKNTSISFQLPPELFGINRKSYVLREDIFDFCSMQEVKTSSMVAYMAYLHYIYSKQDSQYIFADPSLLSSGQNTPEIRARNLCSRLMSTKENQLDLAPCNPGGHWFLVAINAYENMVYCLDSMRTGSREDVKNVTNTAIAIFRSQKNLKTT